MKAELTALCLIMALLLSGCDLSGFRSHETIPEYSIHYQDVERYPDQFFTEVVEEVEGNTHFELLLERVNIMCGRALMKVL